MYTITNKSDQFGGALFWNATSGKVQRQVILSLSPIVQSIYAITWWNQEEANVCRFGRSCLGTWLATPQLRDGNCFWNRKNMNTEVQHLRRSSSVLLEQIQKTYLSALIIVAFTVVRGRHLPAEPNPVWDSRPGPCSFFFLNLLEEDENNTVINTIQYVPNLPHINLCF